MTKPQVKIVNSDTGEEIIREANAQEIAQMEADSLLNDQLNKIETEALAAKAAAEAKLAALGLTAEDLKALGL